jgi:hypothetical protein
MLVCTPPLLSSRVGDIFGMCVAQDIFAKINPKDTVDKLNKSKLSGNINIVTKTRKFPLLVMDMLVRILGSVRVLAHARTGTGICI